ncbi:MAG: DUF1848 domain-containing protein [Solobacterium sp.]|nr:DUF1848 domain-containing protein [Solobacterium sp.]
MILNTGSRTDIPAFYSEWFANRLREGFVLVRNPYYPALVTRYELDPQTVDVLSFCTKNPAPMLGQMELLKPFRQLWYVTLTPYGKDIEPNVPDKHEVIRTIRELSQLTGRDALIWRYDPIFLSAKYSMDYHFRAFRTIASELRGYVSKTVISFLDLYAKTKRNFPEGTEVGYDDQIAIVKELAELARENGMKLYTCHEAQSLAAYGADPSGCMSQSVVEEAIHEHLDVPRLSAARQGCGCLLGNDIGVYNTCRHFCRYCYANYDRETVMKQVRLHDPESPLLIGHLEPEDKVTNAVQKSYLSRQLRLDL